MSCLSHILFAFFFSSKAPVTSCQDLPLQLCIYLKICRLWGLAMSYNSATGTIISVSLSLCVLGVSTFVAEVVEGGPATRRGVELRTHLLGRPDADEGSRDVCWDSSS